MAFPTALTNQQSSNPAALDAEVVGNSPAIAMGNYYLSTSTALSHAAMNATANQNQTWMMSNVLTYRMISEVQYLTFLAMSDLIDQDVFA